MDRKFRNFSVSAALLLGLVNSLTAASANTYQVTGPITALTASTITVQKNDETWEIARDANAKGDASLKVGDRVTIHYRMTATKIDASGAKSAGDAKSASSSDTSSAPTSKAKKSGDR